MDRHRQGVGDGDEGKRWCEKRGGRGKKREGVMDRKIEEVRERENES